MSKGALSRQYELPANEDWHHTAWGRVHMALKMALDPNSQHGEWVYPRFWDDLAVILESVDHQSDATRRYDAD